MLDGHAAYEARSADGTRASDAPQAPPSIPTLPLVPADVLELATRQRAALAERYKQPETRTAQLESNCHACHRRVRIGDQIAGVNGWVHLTCAVCAACGSWILKNDDADAVMAPDSVGRVHRACQPAAAG